MSTCNENRSRSRKNSACSTCALQASSWSSVRYHCCNWCALTRTRGQHRPPVPRADRADIVAPDAAIVDRFPVQQAAELVEVEMRCQKIAAAKIDHGAMPRLTVVVAIGFDHAHVFALHVLADVRPDHSQEHPATRGNGKTCPCDIARCSLRFAITKPTR